MPAKEIKELRKTGKLDEALSMAQSELLLKPDDIWAKRNISWVYYDYLKLNCTLDKFETFRNNLNSIKSLELPDDEKMLFDQLSWQIGKMGFALIKEQPCDVSKFIILFELIQEFHFTKPSEGYSFLFKAFHKGLKESDKYTQFADWWNLQSLRPEDFQKEQMPNGKDVMALAEQAYITYAKHLLPKQIQPGEIIFDKEKAESFLPLLDKIIENYPGYQYPAYFKAKLLLALGEKDTLLSSLLPFVKKKRNDFWAWEVLSEAFSNDKEKILACYCRALNCQGPEEMLISLRQKMASELIKRKLYNEAKTEIELLIRTRQFKGYKIPNEVSTWQSQPWYINAMAKPSNSDFYKCYFDIADGLLFSDMQKELVLVEFVNKDKKILNFVGCKTRSGFFKYDRFLNKVEVGDRLLARIEGTGTDVPYKVFTLEVTDQPAGSDLMKDFKGKLRKNENQSYGFVDDIFIDPYLIEKHKLINGVELTGTTIISFNKKKNDWGWKAIKLNF